MIRPLAGLFATLAFGPAAFADCSVTGMTVDGALGPKVGIFDTTGKFIEEISGDQLAVGRELLGCDESLGLVKIRLVSGAEKWVDRAELKIGLPAGSQPTKICVLSPTSRAADHTEPAVAGIDPKAPKDCVAPKPAPTTP
ncbi:MAG: hypothetical protein ABI661_11990 [Gammaproteobacteria bacterium]